jgi:hypothetical protein
MDNLSLIDWVYDGIWNEYPFLRLLELKRKYKLLSYLIETVPIQQFAELEAYIVLNPVDDINITQFFNDLKQEIVDIDEYIGGN